VTADAIFTGNTVSRPRRGGIQRAQGRAGAGVPQAQGLDGPRRCIRRMDCRACRRCCHLCLRKSRNCRPSV